MSENLFKKRKYEFVETIMKLKRLPKVWEFHFTDGTDQRLWFNKIYKLDVYRKMLSEVDLLLKQYNIKILNDTEKEEEFLNCIKSLNRIPFNNEVYFSDSMDMYDWYMSYKNKNHDFETIVHNSLSEYRELNLATIWPDIKQEFIDTLKELKRVPKHGEVILQNDIDIRVIFDKLETYDPKFYEKLKLHLQTYNSKSLSIDTRIKELKQVVSILGYIPDLQEKRFSDGTDMLTWYIKYKNKLPNLEKEINRLVIKDNPNKKVNIYLIPNFRNTGGKFYTIFTNVGERLDLSSIESYEEASKIDSTVVKRGGVILKKDEEIDSVSFKKGKSK